MDRRTETNSTAVSIVEPTNERSHAPPSPRKNNEKQEKFFPRSDTISHAPQGPIEADEAIKRAYMYPVKPVLEALQSDGQIGRAHI